MSKKSKRNSKRKSKKSSPDKSKKKDNSSGGSSMTHDFINEFGRKFFFTLLGILVAYLIVYVGTLVRNNLKKFHYIGEKKEQSTISVSATGEVEAKPDMATVRMGMKTTSSTVDAAQKANNKTINNLISELKSLGIKEENIKTTDYSVSQEYDYSDGKREVVGQTVSQDVKVKIMDMDKTSKVLDLAGKLEVNQVQGVDYEIKQPEKLKEKARQKAVKQAKKKAFRLSRDLGVRLERIVSYNENTSGNILPMMEKTSFASGGRGDTSTQIEPGEQTVSISVNIQYEIR